MVTPKPSQLKPEATEPDYCCRLPSEPSLSEEQAREYASWFKALSDPTRLQILNVLARQQEPLCVCDIVARFNLGQPAVSHHLKILREARFVTSSRQGSFIYYSINRACLNAFPQAAHQIMDA